MVHAQTPVVKQKLPSLTKQKSTTKKAGKNNKEAETFVQAYEKENGSLFMKITIPEGVNPHEKNADE